jgi:hypothetical protein
LAKEKTHKSCYASSYGGGWVTATQRIAEITCERYAFTKNQTLGPRFWSNPGPWSKYFLQQMAQANKLLTEFSADLLFRALRRSDAKKIVSLGAPWFKDILFLEQAKLAQEEKAAKTAVIPETVDVNLKPVRRSRTGKSLREKLE